MHYAKRSARRRKSLQEQQAKFDARPRLEWKFHTPYGEAENANEFTERRNSQLNLARFQTECTNSAINLAFSFKRRDAFIYCDEKVAVLESVFSRRGIAFSDASFIDERKRRALDPKSI